MEGADIGDREVRIVRLVGMLRTNEMRELVDHSVGESVLRERAPFRANVDRVHRKIGSVEFRIGVADVEPARYREEERPDGALGWFVDGQEHSPRNEADRGLHSEKELLNLAQTRNRILRAVDVEVPSRAIDGELPEPIEVRQAARAGAELQPEDGGIQRRARGRGAPQGPGGPR